MNYKISFTLFIIIINLLIRLYVMGLLLWPQSCFLSYLQAQQLASSLPFQVAGGSSCLEVGDKGPQIVG